MSDTPEWSYSARVVNRAAAMRRWHYMSQGATPLNWRDLTDAQKLPWLLRAAKVEPTD